MNCRYCDVKDSPIYVVGLGWFCNLQCEADYLRKTIVRNAVRYYPRLLT